VQFNNNNIYSAQFETSRCIPAQTFNLISTINVNYIAGTLQGRIETSYYHRLLIDIKLYGFGMLDNTQSSVVGPQQTSFWFVYIRADAICAIAQLLYNYSFGITVLDIKYYIL